MKKLRKIIRQNVVTLPQQSLTAMKVAFGIRAQYMTLAMLSILMVTQIIGVAIFSGKAQALTQEQLTTLAATNIDPTSAKLNLQTGDLNNIEAVDYSFEYGTDTSYGSTAAVSTTQTTFASSVVLTGNPGGSYYSYGGSKQAMDRHGNLYVWYPAGLYKYNSSGQYILTFDGTSGAGDASSMQYTSIAFDSEDNVYIGAGEGATGISKYSADGDLIGTLPGTPSGTGSGRLATDSLDNVYVLSTTKIYKYSSSGVLLADSTLPESTSLLCGGNIAVDSTGIVYVIQVGTSCNGKQLDLPSTILKFSSDLQSQGEWDAVGAANNFYIDANDVLYLNGRKLYTKSGSIISTDGPLANTSERLLKVDTNSGLVYSMNIDEPALNTLARKGGATVSDLTCGTTYHFRAKAVVDGDTVYGDDQQFTTSCNALQITTGSLSDASLGQSYTAQIDTNGPGSPVTRSIIAGQLPSGLTMDSDGAITGTPTHAGTYQFTVRAVDDSSYDTGTDEQELSLFVSGQDLDVIDGSESLTVGDSYTGQIEHTGGLGGAVTFEVDVDSPDGLPPGLNLGSDGALSGTLTTAGSYFVGIKATEGPLTAFGYIQFNVEEPVLPAVQLADDTLNPGRVGVSYNSNEVVNSTTDGFGTKSYEVISGTVPPGLALDIDGTVAGTPTTAGTYIFTAEVTDITGSDSAEFTLVINPPFPPRTNTPIVSIASPADSTVFDYQHDSVTVSGTGPANQEITTYMDDEELGTTVADGDGNWTYDVNNIFPGDHSFDAKWIPAKDVAFVPVVRGADYSSELQIIDTASRQRIKTVLLPQNSIATTVTVNHDGTKVYAAGYDFVTNTSTVWEFDVASGQLGRTLSLAGYVGQTSQLVITSDDQFAYLQKMTLNNLILIKLDLASLSVAGTPTSIAMTGTDWDNARNNLYSLPLVIDDESVYVAASRTNSGTADITIVNQNSQTISSITASGDARASSNQRLIVSAGDSIYTLVNNKLITIDASSHTVTYTSTISQLDSSSNRPIALAVDAIQGKAYISVTGGRIYTFDLDTENVSYVTLAGSNPYNTPSWGLQLTSDDTQVYSTGNFGSIQILDTQLGQLIPATQLLTTTTAGQVLGAGDFVGEVVASTASVAFSVDMAPEDPEVIDEPEESFLDEPESEEPTITDVTPASESAPAPSKTTPIKAPQSVVSAQNNIFALAKRIPEPFAIGFPWFLLALALVLVGIQYSQVHAESASTKRMQDSVAHQKRLVDEQNNFVALSTHYLHTPLTVMEGEISLMIKAGTLTQAQATKLKATLTSLSAEAEATLAQEEQDKVE